MKKILIAAICVSLGMVALGTLGCEQESASGGGSSDMPTMAYNFRDGAPKYYDEQKTCPVCGGEPIKEDIHAEYQMKRVYFDKQECAQKFKDSPQEYIQKWMERVQKEQQEQAEEMRRQSEGGQ